MKNEKNEIFFKDKNAKIDWQLQLIFSPIGFSYFLAFHHWN